MPRVKIFAYAVISALTGAFGLTAWLASESRFLEAISVIGVATTLAWFVTRALNKNDGRE